MDSLLSAILVAIGLLLFVEGAFYTLFPGLMKFVMAHMQEMSERDLRYAGLIVTFFGFGLVWLVKSF